MWIGKTHLGLRRGNARGGKECFNKKNNIPSSMWLVSICFDIEEVVVDRFFEHASGWQFAFLCLLALGIVAT